jgi:acetate kinase
MFAWLDTASFLAPGCLDAVGHRVVHGGPLFVAPTHLDDVIAALTQLHELALLHNEPAQAAIQAAQAMLGTRVPTVAVFDTAFHPTMPAWAAQYAIPRGLATRYISTDDATLHAYVMLVDEARIIARDTVHCLGA